MVLKLLSNELSLTAVIKNLISVQYDYAKEEFNGTGVVNSGYL